MTDASPGFAGGCVFYREGYACMEVFRRGDVGIAPYAITKGARSRVDRVVRPYETGHRGRRPLQRDVEDAVPYNGTSRTPSPTKNHRTCPQDALPAFCRQKWEIPL